MRVEIPMQVSESAAVRTVKNPELQEKSTIPTIKQAEKEKLARQKANARILFGSRWESIFNGLKDFESKPELVIPCASKLLQVLDKADGDKLEKFAEFKAIKSFVKSVEKLVDAKTMKELFAASNTLRLPKPLQSIHDSFPQWGMKQNSKYTPTVKLGSAHGDELRKLEYIKESKAHFIQHIKDGLMRNHSYLKLEIKNSKMDDPSGKGKIEVASFYLTNGSKSALVGRWQRGGQGWHYDRLPKSIAR
tara:strand:- start:94942 stop:95685 length:744 start_codon:yes stop_codon:yes gene_type:complete